MKTIVVIEKTEEGDLGIKTKGSWFVREYEDQEDFDNDCEKGGGFHESLEEALEAVKDIFEEAEFWV